MNDLLELKGKLETKKFSGNIKLSLLSSESITTEHLEKLKSDLERLLVYWNNKDIIDGTFISAYYSRTISKSSRISRFFSKSNEDSNDYVRGVRFNNIEEKKHIITYFVPKPLLNDLIIRINVLIDVINTYFNGKIDASNFDIIDDKHLRKYNISKTKFKTYIKDLVEVNKFDVFINNDQIENNAYITLFNTDKKENISKILNKLGIDNTDYEILEDDTIYATDEVLRKIRNEANYMINMATVDFANYYLENENKIDPTFKFYEMPKPSNEPTIGVIDTLFDENVYFSSWVKYEDWLNKDLPRDKKDYIHGTEVSSIIVNGGTINTKYDDECGYFKVRHFGVAKQGVNNSFDIIKKIERIVKENSDIHVWNVSLGSRFEINDNVISPEAALLDKLQNENNVIFVVSGTNKSQDKIQKIGAPADSINSVVVNAVDKNGKVASYSRKGKVLSFFIKPDICTFGGDDNEYMNVCSPTGLNLVRGTSFAAPWISRKLSYLIDKMHLSREIAKALLIDSAVGFNVKNKDEDYMGFGIVPTKISDVLLSKKNEIKFYIEGISTDYSTYTYNLPVPMVNNRFPFYAKAVLCYFPKCTRSQGVDYTDTELDIQFGRISDKGKINSINKNTQGEENETYTYEETARRLFRKWDNVKVVVEEQKDRKVPRLGNNINNLWGIRITNKNRNSREKGQKFGIVVTLSEMSNKNRIDEFIEQCILKGWIVNNISVDNMLTINAKQEEIIEFDN